jgi:hypothetical protein
MAIYARMTVTKISQTEVCQLSIFSLWDIHLAENDVSMDTTIATIVRETEDLIHYVTVYLFIVYLTTLSQ